MPDPAALAAPPPLPAPAAACPAAAGPVLPRLLASLGGIGFLRPAPGTWGSALVLPAVLGGPWLCLGLAVLLGLLGWWALHRLPAARTDPGWVVIDEGAGQSLALAALPLGAGLPGVGVAFLLFRLFDITKPGPVGWADRRHGPTGVMLDDIIAGALAGAIILALRWGGLLS
jgi:phosphatidylglycerophosphatase A